MPDPANITILTGPDRGKVFPLEEELVHCGRGADNQISLSDPLVSEHQFSIVSRNGRYAIFTPLEKGVDVDGNLLPPGKWVWLPNSAKVRISEKTLLHFMENLAAGETNGKSGAPSQPVESGKSLLPMPPPKPSKGKGKAGKTSGKVARFITDAGGETLVRLGEDGKLPALALAEAGERKLSDKQQQERNPTVIYIAIAFSFVMSLLMMFVDADSSGSTESEIRAATKEIAEFYGPEGRDPEPYQRLLRNAKLAAAARDRDGERTNYRRVLDMLNSEDLNKYNGLTGTLDGDKRLRKHIGVLMNRP